MIIAITLIGLQLGSSQSNEVLSIRSPENTHFLQYIMVMHKYCTWLLHIHSHNVECL